MTALVPQKALAQQDLLALAFDGLSDTTMKLYRGDWDRFLKYAGVSFKAFLKLHKADAALLVNRYIKLLARRGKSPATRARAKQAICVVVKRLYCADLAPWSLDGLIRKLRVKQYKDVEGIDHESWTKLLATAAADGSRRGLRDVAILLLLHDSGLRCREVATLELEHYDRPKKRMWVWSKRMEEGDREAVPLNVRQMAAMKAWLKERRYLSGALFMRIRDTEGINSDGVGYVVRYWCRKAGIPEVGPHQLRHAAITKLSRDGAAPVELMSFARHSSFDTTQNYIQVAEGQVRKLTDMLGGDE